MEEANGPARWFGLPVPKRADSARSCVSDLFPFAFSIDPELPRLAIQMLDEHFPSVISKMIADYVTVDMDSLTKKMRMRFGDNGVSLVSSDEKQIYLHGNLNVSAKLTTAELLTAGAHSPVTRLIMRDGAADVNSSLIPAATQNAILRAPVCGHLLVSRLALAQFLRPPLHPVGVDATLQSRLSTGTNPALQTPASLSFILHPACSCSPYRLSDIEAILVDDAGSKRYRVDTVSVGNAGFGSLEHECFIQFVCNNDAHMTVHVTRDAIKALDMQQPLQPFVPPRTYVTYQQTTARCTELHSYDLFAAAMQYLITASTPHPFCHGL